MRTVNPGLSAWAYCPKPQGFSVEDPGIYVKNTTSGWEIGPVKKIGQEGKLAHTACVFRGKIPVQQTSRLPENRQTPLQ